MTPPVEPVSVKDALVWARSQMDTLLSGSPALEAEVLLGHILGRNRAWLRAWPERTLTTEQCDQFTQSVTRRAEGFPIAYLIGEREFWSRSFLVRPAVLIPRPDTELLIERALDIIPAHEVAHVLELGTGSGAIAVTLAIERPSARITATDISRDALEVATLNASRLGAQNIRFLQGNWLEPNLPPRSFDLIVSNPPYIADQDPHLSQGDLRFEPLLALASGPDGLDAIREIAQSARDVLKPGGQLLLEHGYQQASAVADLLEQLGYARIHHHPDLQGHLRATLANSPSEPKA